MIGDPYSPKPTHFSMPSLRLFRLSPLFFSLCALVACGTTTDTVPAAAASATGGTLVVSTPAEPDNLLPPITTSFSGRQVEDLIFQRLADIGTALGTVGDAGFTPNLATRWEWAPDSLSIAFHLDPAARWHDGVPVRASDVRFTFALYTDPAAASPTAMLLSNIDSISVAATR